MKNKGLIFTLRLFTILSIIIAAGCGAPAEKNAEVADEHNVLTDEEITEGWMLMFDGTTLNGWRGYLRPDVPDGWIVEDGTIFLEEGGDGDIMFDRKFLEFHLKVDWKISEGGNSGIFYLIQELEGRRLWHSAPELQLLDNDAYTDLNHNQYAPALYDLVPASPQNTRPAGEWNTVEVIIKDKYIIHRQNGEEVVRVSIDTPEWDAMVEESKFPSDVFAEYVPGYIALQDHGDQVWFRNLKIIEL